jgi:hypothetical protein
MRDVIIAQRQPPVTAVNRSTCQGCIGFKSHPVMRLHSGREASDPDVFHISFPVTWRKGMLAVAKGHRDVPKQSPTRGSYLKDLALRNINSFSHSRGEPRSRSPSKQMSW